MMEVIRKIQTKLVLPYGFLTPLPAAGTATCFRALKFAAMLQHKPFATLTNIFDMN